MRPTKSWNSAKKRFTKNLWSARTSQQKPYLTTVPDEAAQATYIADQILSAREAGVPLKAQALLFRASQHSALVELELARRNIPFVKHGGLKFLEAAHVKDVISVLRWCQNPSDRLAGFRTLQLLPGIGPSTAAKILDIIAAEGKVVAVLKRFVVAKGTAAHWPTFISLISQLRKAKDWPAEFDAVRSWYERLIDRLYDDGDARAEDIVRLQQIAAGYVSRERFLTELTLDPPDATNGHSRAGSRDEEHTVLSTIHSAKGGEWKVVRVLNVVEGCIPSNLATKTAAEIEEERRLLHVAMTRAKDELDLIAPQRLFTYQRGDDDKPHVYAALSRFIPKSIHDAFELQHWHERPSRSTAGEFQSHVRKVNVAASIERMWR